MASSNRHWPSMFKSKPACNHHQWQHDINSSLLPTACHRPSPFSSGCEERSPEPKPRWNPKPEQIRILEAIFNSGMVNPPREEIRKIRAQLQEYGQVGDANVFYWFQNRKSRSKHKQRHLQNNKTHSQTPPNSTTTNNTAFISAPITAPSSSSSSSDKSSSKPFSVGPTNVVDLSNSPTASVNQAQQPYFHHPASGEFLPEPFFFPVQQPAGGAFGFPEMVHVSGGDPTLGSCTGVLLTDLMMMNHHHDHKKGEDEKMKVQNQDMSGYTVTTSTTPHTLVSPTSLIIPSTATNIGVCGGAGVGETGGLSPGRSTVFINDVAFEVAVGPFNVREAFGEDAVLIHSSGQPVVTNEWGVTLQSLQHGAFYYLVRTLTTSHVNTFDLI